MKRFLALEIACLFTAATLAGLAAGAQSAPQNSPSAAQTNSSASPAPPQSAALNASDAVPDGTHFLVRLNDALNTGKDRPGRKFTVTIIEPLETGGGGVLAPGSKITGHISRIESASLSGRARLWLTFDNLDALGGREPIVAEVSGVPGQGGVKPDVGKEGEVEAQHGSAARLAVAEALPKVRSPAERLHFSLRGTMRTKSNCRKEPDSTWSSIVRCTSRNPDASRAKNKMRRSEGRDYCGLRLDDDRSLHSAMARSAIHNALKIVSSRLQRGEFNCLRLTLRNLETRLVAGEFQAGIAFLVGALWIYFQLKAVLPVRRRNFEADLRALLHVNLTGREIKFLRADRNFLYGILRGSRMPNRNHHHSQRDRNRRENWHPSKHHFSRGPEFAFHRISPVI